jgi:prolyl-tRNA synthetase
LITPIAYKFNRSYKDFPFAFYQIQTKFRNEARAKSGILRGREFRMKDLYSFHTSEEDLKKYYEVVKKAYINVFNDLGIGKDTVIALASGGDFTKDYSHEFQTRCEAGEDVIYLNKETGVAYNEEVAPQDALDQKGEGKYEIFPACEVGNIFPLNTKFSKAFNYTFTDADGQEKIVYMGSYGIGPSRVMGVLVEKFNDENGIIWPKQVAPFQVHLVSLNGTEQKSEELYAKLTKMNIEVLWDDRDISAGEKFIDADLIGNPIRLVLSKRNNGLVEWKFRNNTKTELLDVEEVLVRISKNV